MFHSRISVIQAHTRDQRTDQLYQPLRKTFLADTTAKKQVLYDASHHSHLSHTASPHTYAQNHRLGEQTFILEDVSLKPTHNYYKIPKNRNYTVINAEERVLPPISAQQLKNRIKNKQQVIVYTYGDEQPVQEPPKVAKIDVIKPKPLGIKVTQPKYNLFSIIDEPINNLFLGKSCTCPANQLVASQKHQTDWQNIKHLYQ